MILPTVQKRVPPYTGTEKKKNEKVRERLVFFGLIALTFFYFTSAKNDRRGQRPRPSLTLVTNVHRQSTDSPALSFFRSEHFAFSDSVRASTMAPRPGKSARKIWQDPKKRPTQAKSRREEFHFQKVSRKYWSVVCVWVVGCPGGKFVDSIAGGEVLRLRLEKTTDSNPPRFALRSFFPDIQKLRQFRKCDWSQHKHVAKSDQTQQR